MIQTDTKHNGNPRQRNYNRNKPTPDSYYSSPGSTNYSNPYQYPNPYYPQRKYPNHYNSNLPPNQYAIYPPYLYPNPHFHPSQYMNPSYVPPYLPYSVPPTFEPQPPSISPKLQQLLEITFGEFTTQDPLITNIIPKLTEEIKLPWSSNTLTTQSNSEFSSPSVDSTYQTTKYSHGANSYDSYTYGSYLNEQNSHPVAPSSVSSQGSNQSLQKLKAEFNDSKSSSPNFKLSPSAPAFIPKSVLSNTLNKSTPSSNIASETKTESSTEQENVNTNESETPLSKISDIVSSEPTVFDQLEASISPPPSPKVKIVSAWTNPMKINNDIKISPIFQQDSIIQKDDKPSPPSSPSPPPAQVYSKTETIKNTSETTPDTSNGPTKKPAFNWAQVVKKSESSKINTSILAPLQSSFETHYGPVKSNIASLFSDTVISLSPVLIHPRGLVNNANVCYMNSILQTLLHCPPFFNLIRQIGNRVTQQQYNSDTPLLDAMVTFMKLFDIQTNSKEPMIQGDDLNSESFYHSLRNINRFVTSKGQQEDAEEFLSFLLDHLHEEVLNTFVKEGLEMDSQLVPGRQTFLRLFKKQSDNAEKSLPIKSTPVTCIFSGIIHSILTCPGDNPSKTTEVFQSLHLDITPDHIQTVEHALLNLCVPENIEGYVNSKGSSLTAVKQAYFETMPLVLVLHLKRFVYDPLKGISKSHKKIDVKPKLTIPAQMFSKNRTQTYPVNYQLFSIVYHHGEYSGGGHYTCRILRGDGTWLYFNDTQITPIPQNQANQLQDEYLPYLLFYCAV